MIKKLPANLIYLIYSGGSSLFFTLAFTVNMVYFVQKVGLNPLQMVLVGTVLETACFIFEIPTGIVADVYSRRLSVIIGVFLIGCGFILQGLVPTFIAVLAAQVLWGVGATFTSGAADAWIADETGGEKLEQTYLKAAQVGQFFSFVGILISVILSRGAMNLPIIISGSLFIVLAAFLAVYMPEKGFKREILEGNSPWKQMGTTLHKGLTTVRNRPILIIILCISLIEGLYSEGYDRLWTPHFLSDITFPTFINLQPVAWFGGMNAFAMLLSMGATELIKRHLDKSGRMAMLWMLFLINGVLSFCIMILGLSGQFGIAIMAYWLIYVLRTVNGPIFSAWINNNLHSEVRATILSTSGQLNALGQIIGGPVIGIIATKATVGLGIFSSGIVLTPMLLLYLYVIYRSKRKEMTTDLHLSEE
jgi:MFS transporter, DHA3 family, tetracycline resistance protein